MELVNNKNQKRKVPITMITEKEAFEKGTNEIVRTMHKLKIPQLLRNAGIRKAQGASVFEIFKFLVLLVFQQRNMFHFLQSDRKDTAWSKNTYYRFLNNCTYGWRNFLTTLAVSVSIRFQTLTGPGRVYTLVLDDSFTGRERSKKVELLANVYDHTDHRYKKGFNMLTLGWTDGYSFVPMDFAMLSSAKEKNRYNEVNSAVDKRTHGYKRRKEAMEKKPQAAINMIANALKHGVRADYILMDSWFTNEPFIKAIMALNLDVIGMVKDIKQRYWYHNKLYTLRDLAKAVPHAGNGSDIMGSLTVKTKDGIPVKLVFVRNRCNHSQWLVLLSTDLSINSREIVRIYGNRWSIEVFFKSAKSLLKLASEFEGRSYDLMISHTTIVFTRHILLEWIQREHNDWRTYGDLFYMLCDDVRDLDFHTALQTLFALFSNLANHFTDDLKSLITRQLQLWFASQPAFIKGVFANVRWES
jgi:hypothetical protein